jgi:hypothetical protein
MDCTNHSGVVALANCTGCADPFCKNCLVTIRNQKYCASCKAMAISPAVAEPTVPSPLAKEALQVAILSIFCVGIILGPVAVQKALKAKDQIANNPNMLGIGRANAAMFIGIVVFVLNIVGLFTRASGK